MLFAEMEAARTHDVDWRRGRVGLYVHYAGDDVLAVAKEAYQRFFSENALGPKAFPSLKKFEDEVVDWTLDLLHAPAAATGVMTSGGHREPVPRARRRTRLGAGDATVDRAARDRHSVERAPRVRQGRALPRPRREAHCRCAPTSAPTSTRWRRRSRRRTILVAGSAPALPHGVIDPIADDRRARARARPVVPRRCVRRRLHGAVRQARRLPDFRLRLRASTASRRSPPTCTSTASPRRARRCCCSPIARCASTSCSTSTTGRAGTTAPRRSAARGPAARSRPRGR